MLEIPGYRYDPEIRNYLPILNNTPNNRALNLVTASQIIEYDRLNTLEHQSKESEEHIHLYNEKAFPQLQLNNFNTYNVLKSQQIGQCNIKSRSLYNVNKIRFNAAIGVDFESDDRANYYHNLYKCFPPDIDSQIMALSYSSSPYHQHHSILRVLFKSTESDKVSAKSELIKHYDSLSGIKVSIDNKTIILLSKKECILIDKANGCETELRFQKELPSESQYAFDSGDSLHLGINSKKGITSLDSFDLSCEGRRSSNKCHWDRKFVFRDLLLDGDNGRRLFCLLRGHTNGPECILPHDLRCTMPTQKNVRRLSLNFHQHSGIQMTRVPGYEGLLVTSCLDGAVNLWDLRWTDRPAVSYGPVAPGRQGGPQTAADRNGDYLTICDGDGVVRVCGLRTGLTLYHQAPSPSSGSSPGCGHYLYEPYGLLARPCLSANEGPASISLRTARL